MPPDRHLEPTPTSVLDTAEMLLFGATDPHAPMVSAIAEEAAVSPWSADRHRPARLGSPNAIGARTGVAAGEAP